jgi:putative FmdB family regulatory protein
VPIYKYRCTACEHILTAMHPSKELKTDCEKCERTGTLIKLLNKVYVNKDSSLETTPPDTGELTKKFIEENREVLKQQKREVKERSYDES